MTVTQMGLTVAIQASDVDAILQEGGREALKREVKDLADQATISLRAYVGGAEPRGPVAVDFRGPEDDPLQGLIYGLSVAAPFDTDDLPSTCPAYGDWNTNREGTPRA